MAVQYQGAEKCKKALKFSSPPPRCETSIDTPENDSTDMIVNAMASESFAENFIPE